jgi:hypothetical protein
MTASKFRLFCAALLLAGSLLTGGVSSAQAPAATPPASNSATDFAAEADAVLQQLSAITGLQQVTPLKKSLRTRQEIRDYIIHEMHEDKTDAERYAGKRSAEAFGLIPRGFDLDSFMVDLLTEQVAGVYDPNGHEFYVADWMTGEDKGVVMAHELMHALEDQHFQIQAWEKAARPNDDAELARGAVLEGSATAAMIDYMLQGTGRSLQNLPEIDPSLLVGSLDDSPMLQKAPPFIRDTLMFPYFAGLTFTAAVLKPDGWKSLPGIFARPPLSTQQIMHPALYRSGKVPVEVRLPPLESSLGPGWIRLEENVLGEFGWKEVLKQFLNEPRAGSLASFWEGDRYAVYERSGSKRLLLVTHIRLASEQQANRFFGQYSEALEKKHTARTDLMRRPNFFSFQAPDGGVFLHCSESDCITLEGGSRAQFIDLNKKLGFPPVPPPSRMPNADAAKQALTLLPPTAPRDAVFSR